MRTVGYTALLVLTALVTAIGPTGPVSAAPASPGRVCAAPTKPHRMACMAIRASGGTNSPAAAGYGPSDLRSAYSVPSGGKGVTVAIVDAYDDPRAESDLATYRSHYGLPACTSGTTCFRKVSQTGSASALPRPSSSWSAEISLDLDMVSAICPACHLLLVEANSNSDTDLFTAINRAVKMGARVVSNSWGGDESSSAASLDRKYLNHPGVAITASTGDDGYGTEYPATSRYVTAVGGTSLRRASNSRGWTETAWSGGGSGCSAYEAKPSWQVQATGCGKRAEADVSAVSDPNTGVNVYQTYGGSGWAIYGGTSAASPIVAALYALAGKPGAKDYPASYPYAHASKLHDVSGGRNGGCGTKLCVAAKGWDGPTGLGTPNGAAPFQAATVATDCADPVLTDGGFEDDSPAWSESSALITTGTAADPAYAGTHLARLAGSDTLSQTVTVPAGCTGATLTAMLRVTTAERTTSAAVDTLRVLAGTTVLATRSNLDANGYVEVSADLGGSAGTTFTLTLASAETGSRGTTFDVDDVRIGIESPA